MGQNPKSIGTHDGAFHADEVTACALLIFFGLCDRDKIVRTRDMAHLNRCEYVCDVGTIYDPAQRRFDHHQADYQGELSSAGMVLLFLRDSKCIEEHLYEYLNRLWIKGVDDHDNGRVTPLYGHCSFSGVIAQFVPPSYDATQKEMEEAFYEALDFTLAHLKRMHDRYLYIQSCEDVVLSAMKEQSKVLIFEKALPWLEIFFQNGGETHPAQFVIMPSGEHWKLRGIPPSYEDRMNVRIPLPQKWAGLSNDDLKRISGIPGAVFCHKGRFISVWETKEDALKALHEILPIEEYQ